MVEVITAYNAPPKPLRLDGVGIFFLAFVSIWTACIIAAMLFLILHRNSPIVRIRGLYLTLGAVCFLHPYWVIGHLVVPVFGTMNIILAFDLQFFFMGIWLPIGIGLFQASNLRFLYVAKLQKRYMRPITQEVVETRCSHCNHKPSLWRRFRSLSYSTKVYSVVGTAITVQIAVTVGTWLACRKYHPTFGVVGTGLRHGTVDEQMWWLNQGWEWWPTIAWQFLWTWILAPIMIIRAWHIEDTLGWRTQTIGCCIAGLHATPMYLIASYVPAFKPVNVYFTASNWIHLSMMIWTILILFVPVFQIMRHKRLQQQAIDTEAKRSFDSHSTLTPTSSLPTKGTSTASIADAGLVHTQLSTSDEEHLLTTSALDHILRVNPEPLQAFSASRDFSGENIAFLVRAMRWRSAVVDESGHINGAQRYRAFTQALEIYAFFISPRDAQFPLNISGRQLQPLVELFADASKTVYGGEARKDSAVPDNFDGPPITSVEKNTALGSCVQELSRAMLYIGAVPDDFSAAIFDDVVAHVRDLVFLNTWPKFVRELRRTSLDSQRTEKTWGSHDTLVEKTVRSLRGVFGGKRL